jgi:phosphoglycolate phosphatase-like HAD superfamily hydrolase
VGDLLVLWDIDGTLLNAGGVGGDLYEMVFSSMFGCQCERLAPMAGRTDRAIILDTLEMAGIPEPRRHVDLFIEGLRSHAPEMFQEAQRKGRALPGAADALRAVASARVGTSTIGFTVPGTALPAPEAAGACVGGSAGGASPIPVSVIPAPARASAASVSACSFVVAAILPFGSAADAPAPGAPLADPADTVLAANTVLPADTVLPPVTLPVTAPPVYPAPHPATRPSVVLQSPHGRRRPDSGRVFESVLTGNVRTLAEVKLSAVGLRYPLDLCIGAYGDDHEIRTELVHLARRRAQAVHGRSSSDFSGQATIVVGDTPLDIEAALAAGARAVGVATGGFSAAALHEAGAHAVLTDLTSTADVLSALLS